MKDYYKRLTVVILSEKIKEFNCWHNDLYSLAFASVFSC